MNNKWKTKTLGELIDEGIVELKRGKIISKKDIVTFPGDYPIYSSAKEKNGLFGKYGKFMYDEPSITWSVDGGGRLFYRPKHKYSVTNVGGIIRIKKLDVLDYQYLFYVLTLKHSEIKFDWVKKAHPSVIKDLYKGIPMPPITEQRNIATALNKLFMNTKRIHSIANNNIKNTREFKESISKEIFSNENKKWKVTPFGNIITVLTDYHANGSYKTLKEHVYLKNSDDYAWMVRSTDFENNFGNDLRYIDKESYEFLKKSKLYGEEIIISKIGNAGKVYLMPKVNRPCSLAMNLFLIRVDPNLAIPEFVYLYLNSIYGRKQIKERLNGAATQTITKDNVKNIFIPLPHIDEQVNIIKKLNKFLTCTEKLEANYQRKLSYVEELENSMLAKTAMGEVLVKCK